MIDKLRKLFFSRDYNITWHAQRRCDIRGITIEEIEAVIFNGDIVENYPDDKPYPSCLILGYVRETEPLYVLLAYEEQAHIITAHWLDPVKWLDPKTRREKTR